MTAQSPNKQVYTFLLPVRQMEPGDSVICHCNIAGDHLSVVWDGHLELRVFRLDHYPTSVGTVIGN